MHKSIVVKPKSNVVVASNGGDKFASRFKTALGNARFNALLAALEDIKDQDDDSDDEAGPQKQAGGLHAFKDIDSAKIIMNLYRDYVSDTDISTLPQFFLDIEALIMKHREGKSEDGDEPTDEDMEEEVEDGEEGDEDDELPDDEGDEETDEDLEPIDVEYDDDAEPDDEGDAEDDDKKVNTEESSVVDDPNTLVIQTSQQIIPHIAVSGEVQWNNKQGLTISAALMNDLLNSSSPVGASGSIATTGNLQVSSVEDVADSVAKHLRGEK